jgi:hypothetical protein
MKRMFFLALLFPLLSIGQTYREKREADKALRQMADTIAFPVPLQFTFIDTVNLPKTTLYGKCFQYLATKVSNMNLGSQMHDSLSGTIVIPNMTSNISASYRYTLTVDVREGKYRCRFTDFYEADQISGHHLLDTVEREKGMFIGAGTRHQYWQVQKYWLREEVVKIFADMKAFVHKQDDF